MLVEESDGRVVPDAWRKRRDRASGNRVGWGRRPAKTVGTGQDGEMSKGAEVDSSMSERPEHQRPRRLADWLNPTGERKVHSLIDKVYKRKNLEMAWGRVKGNRGAGGVDGQSIDDFAEVREEQLDRLHEDLRDDAYRPQPVRQKRIPKAGNGYFGGCGSPISAELDHGFRRKWITDSGRSGSLPAEVDHPVSGGLERSSVA